MGLMIIFPIISEITYNLFVESLKSEKRTRRSKIALTVRKIIQIIFWFILVFGLIGVGAAFFNSYEGWGYTDSFYFATYTATGIGYGDLIPIAEQSFIFNLFYMYISVCLTVTMLQKASTLFERINDADLMQKLDDLPLSRELLECVRSNAEVEKVRRSDYILYMLVLSGTIEQERGKRLKVKNLNPSPLPPPPPFTFLLVVLRS